MQQVQSLEQEFLKTSLEYLTEFKKIIPHDYQEMLQTIALMEERGLSNEQAQIEAFYENKRRKQSAQ